MTNRLFGSILILSIYLFILWHCIYFLTASVDQESERSLTGSISYCLMKLHSWCWLGLISHQKFRDLFQTPMAIWNNQFFVGIRQGASVFCPMTRGRLQFSEVIHGSLPCGSPHHGSILIKLPTGISLVSLLSLLVRWRGFLKIYLFFILGHFFCKSRYFYTDISFTLRKWELI